MSGKLQELSFEIIQKCPNKCIYCSSDSSVDSDFIIDFRTFTEVVDDAVLLGLNKLSISGGEPFLHPSLIDMVTYAKKRGQKNKIEVYIYTSGIMLTKNNQGIAIEESMLEKLKGTVDKLIFNVQSTKEDKYNKIMGTEGYFDLMQDSIKKAVKIGIFTEIHFVPMSINLNELDLILNMAKNLKVDKISFLRLVVQGRAVENRDIVELQENEVNELIQKLVLIKNEQHNLDIRVGIPLSKGNQAIKCNAGTGKLVIRYDGAVYPCEAYKYIPKLSSSCSPDNVKEKRLLDIYKKSEFIARLIDRPENCNICPAQQRMNMEG